MNLQMFANKKNLLLFCLLITTLILKAGKNDGTIPLVKNGKTNYSIITSPDANAREQRAALLLHNYIFKISGCKIPTSVSISKAGNAIYINESANIKNRDGFSIKTTGKNLFIEGGNYKGCVYGVVALLEKYLGCHYYSPFYKVIPTAKTINLPAINFSDEPINEIRIINISDKVDEDFIDFNRLNTIDEYFAKGYYVHTFNRLIPWQENFKTHPEYFALMNGKRIIDQLCLTNRDVLNLVIKKLEKDMAEQPDKLYWSVSQNDNFSYCQCDNCKKITSEEGSPSGPVIRFVNEVAKHFPAKIISTLAYQYSRQAPAITKPETNVQVMLCTIELNRSKPIEQDSGSQSFVKDIIDWGKICKHIYLWDYAIDFAHSVSPFPNLHVLQPNIQFFTKNNVRAHFQQSNSMRGQEFAELKLYLISRIMWNPNINTAVVLDEFLNGYYAKAAPWIKKYIDQLQSELIKSGEGLDIYEQPASHKDGFLSGINIDKYNYFFDEALRTVAGDSAHLMHVKITRLPLMYAIMEIGKTDMYGVSGWYQEKNGEYLVNEKMKSLLEDFNATCLQANVVRLNEGNLTPQDYYASTQRFINIQVKGNLAFRKKVTASTAPAPQFSGADLSYLTNGVRGANDHKVHWLGWEGKDVDLTLDLEQPISAASIEISSLYDTQRWILHPAAVTCLISQNGKDYTLIGTIKTAGNQQAEEITKLFKFDAPKTNFRYVKFEVKGTIHLFDWHPAPNGTSWMFLDEIIVR